MPFAVIWTHSAEKELEKLEKAVARRIFLKIDGLALQEMPALEKVEGCDFFKFRVGDYRALIDRLPAQGKLVVLHIGHRKNIYKRLRR